MKSWALSNTSINPVYPALSVTVASIRLCDFVSNGFNPKVGLELRTSVNKDLSFQNGFMVFLSCVKQLKTHLSQNASLPMGIKKVRALRINKSLPMSQKNYKYLNNEPEYAPQSKITAHMILIYGPCLGCSNVS